MRKPTIRRRESDRKLSLFISYTTEDRELAAVVESKLKQTFVFAPVAIFRDIRIHEGDDYRADIENNLDAADIMIVLLTDRLKAGYAYPGFELGYFKRSIQARRFIYPGLDRFVIPLCIGSEIPDTMHYIQGIEIKKEDIFAISTDRKDDKTDLLVPSRDEQANPVYKLFDRIASIVASISGKKLSNDDARAIRQNMREAAAELYKYVIEYLQGRVASETFPERKIVIRCSKRLTPSDPSMENSRVELVGKSFEVFGMQENENREYSWQEFMRKIPDQLAAKWSEGIHALVLAVIEGNLENYMVVTTRENQSFRLFVSRIVTYYSGKTEIHIYILLMINPNYGNQITGRLATAIGIGLRFRFLMLEKDSKFQPDELEFPTMDGERLKPIILELLWQLDWILRDSKVANLEDPKLLKIIWGNDCANDIQTMMKRWKECFGKLCDTAHKVLDANEESFDRAKSEFIASLRQFVESTIVMNRDFTAGVLNALSRIVSQPP
jgi:TIR domain